MDLKDVENLAALARIEISEGEKGEILKDMEGILKYINVIANVDVEDIESKYTHYNVWREDEAEERGFSRELIIGQFPDAQEGFLKVKKIL